MMYKYYKQRLQTPEFDTMLTYIVNLIMMVDQWDCLCHI